MSDENETEKAEDAAKRAEKAADLAQDAAGLAVLADLETAAAPEGDRGAVLGGGQIEAAQIAALNGAYSALEGRIAAIEAIVRRQGYLR